MRHIAGNTFRVKVASDLIGLDDPKRQVAISLEPERERLLIELAEHIFNEVGDSKQSDSISTETVTKPEKENPMPTVAPGKPVSTYTCFISYNQADDTFAAKLYADLKVHGIKVWRFAEDAKWGETVWGEITEHIKENDKLVVICSKHSLQSGPVGREIERGLGCE